MKIDAAILAGGRSSRMGSDKAVLDVHGRAMILHVLDAVSAVSERVFVVSNTPDQYDFLDVPVIPDEVVGVGPLGGIHAALRFCKSTHCLVVACDLPFLSPEVLQRIKAGCNAGSICYAASARGPEPLCAIYPKSLLAEIETRITAGQLSVQSLLRDCQAHSIDLRDAAISTFFNVNTREELQHARRLAREG